MKLFLKVQFPLLLFYAVQMLLVPLLYWLTGEGRPLSIVLYGSALSAAVLAVYLGFRYLRHRRLYLKLDDPEASLDSALEPLGDAPLAEAAHRLLEAYSRHYRERLGEESRRVDSHITFMNRWVHQMKTPLSIIQLTAEELDDAAADSIREEVDRLRKGLEMVLYASRLDRFEDDFSIMAVPLRKAVSETVAENRRLFIRRGVKADIRIDGELKVYTDAKWLRFMLAQILTNAVNYSDGSGKTVSAAAFQRGREVILEIRDEGIGIAPEDLKRVFNPYFTGERGRQYRESTGMGLYLVREICGRLGHRVELSSQPGDGTTVRLLFDSGIPADANITLSGL
ncbi:signal transduction histidine kinase [Paenibacillus forsythiae]|uniref:histidine kinase n=1 Tax=Paenibacillus forsythiae TaxID=365616 RepID=A0ABU3HG33_9BACL|nr:sensor histidine kinase [Paenibacillus forsythiae]MDT3428640.1 signal transduction histidine kinase [Paenibacillus forsythiae]